MESPSKYFWSVRLANLKKVLEANNFEVYLADSSSEAKEVVLEKIIPKTGAKSVSWGGSMTFLETGLYDAIKTGGKLKILDVYDKNIPYEDVLELRRQALLVDLFITGTNAVTESGQLVNLDMYGNRIAAITFGPKNVVILMGRNKIVKDVNAAMAYIKNHTAPMNAMRLDKKTPCVKTSVCEECHSPDRICNTWTITEKALPKGRVKVVLINEDLGL